MPPTSPAQPPWTNPSTVDNSEVLRPKKRQDSFILYLASAMTFMYIAGAVLGLYVLFSTHAALEFSSLLFSYLLSFSLYFATILCYRQLTPNQLILTTLSIVPILTIVLVWLQAILWENMSYSSAILFTFITFLNFFSLAGLYAQLGRVPTAYVAFAVARGKTRPAIAPAVLSCVFLTVTYYAVTGSLRYPNKWIACLVSFYLNIYTIIVILAVGSCVRMCAAAEMTRGIITMPRTVRDKPTRIFTTYFSYFFSDGIIGSLPLQLWLLFAYNSVNAGVLFLLSDRRAGMPAILHNRSYWTPDLVSVLCGGSLLGVMQVSIAMLYTTILVLDIVVITMGLLFGAWSERFLIEGLCAWLIMQVLAAPIAAQVTAAIQLYQHDGRAFVSRIGDDELLREFREGVMPQAE